MNDMLVTYLRKNDIESSTQDQTGLDSASETKKG